MSTQTRLGLLIESLSNVAIGFVVAFISQVVIFPFYDIHISASENLAIGAWFTMISIVRGYCVRRYFNK